jgi:hypothetical protein
MFQSLKGFGVDFDGLVPCPYICSNGTIIISIYNKFEMGRVKLGKIPIPTYKVNPDTVDKLRETAIIMGFKHNDGAAVGAFLDMIANIDRDLLIAAAVKSRSLATGESINC